MSQIPTTTAAAPSRQPRPPGLPWWRRILQILAWGLVTAWSLLLLAWLTLHWGILNHIEQWRPQIEARAGRALGAEVRIGRIDVRTGSWVPAFELHDVVVLDAQQREALRLPRVFAALSPRSLLALSPRLSQLLVDGAQLDVRRDAAGRYFVGGLPIGGTPSSDDGEALDRFFEQYEFVVRGGTVRWTDERRGSPPLALSDLDLVVRNGLRRHDLRLDATPPPEFGQRFTLQGRFIQPLLARAGDWRLWSGQLQADLPGADVRALRRHVDLPFELGRGEGALRAWLEVRMGDARELTLDVALRDVGLRLAADVEPMNFEQIEGRLRASRSPDGMAVRAEQFGFVTGDGLHWPRGNAQLSWRQRQDAAGVPTVSAPVTGGAFSADRLDLGLMAAIASRVPVGAPLRRLLAELAPQGIVSAVDASWDGPLDTPDHYRVKSRFAGLRLEAQPATEPQHVGRPGLRNADIELDASETGGTATLAMTDGAIELPGVFEEPLLPLQRLAADLSWTMQPVAGAAPQLELKLRNGSVVNGDAQSDFQATWRSAAVAANGKRGPGYLELDGSLKQGLAARVARYLPLGVPQGTRDYLAHAVTAGRIADGSFHVKGDLADFPFAGAKKAAGEFHIAAQVDDVDLAYVPSLPAGQRGGVAVPAFNSPWPAFTRVGGELVFDRASMEIRNARGQVYGVALSEVQGGIANLDHATLSIEGTAKGPMSDLLRYVANSPVAGWTGNVLTPATASGPGELKLGLSIPLNDASKSTVNGSVTLAGNDVRLRPDLPTLGGATGRVDFTQRGFTVVGAKARTLGGDASFSGGTQPDGSLRFSAQGTASAEALRTAGGAGVASRFAASLSGQASYQLSLGFIGGRPEFELNSNLAGLAIDLPAPLSKPADGVLPLHVQQTLLPESLAAGQTPRDRLRVEFGTLLRADYERELSGEQPQVVRGAVTVGSGEALVLPPRGVQARVDLARLDADAWQAMSRRWLGDEPAGDGETRANPYLPGTFALRLDELVVSARTFSHIVAGLSQDDGIWRANVDAEQLKGYVEYRSPRRSSGSGRVYARLTRLVLPKSETEGMETLLDQQPTSVPGLDIVVDDFELRGMALGRLEVEAVNHGSVAENGREWLLNHFSVSVPEAQLSGSGTWVAARNAGTGRRTAIKFTLDTNDGGALLQRLGLGKTLKGAKGRLAGEIGWLGSPLALDLASLSGQLTVAVESGQFLKADAGAARLLGVLSLQALPRRLLLDFRDVFEEGFPFDNVGGDVKIAQGVATTNNLIMRGVQAAVLMEGQADLARETQDLRVVVVPEINAGTASLAFAVINPAVGLGTFLAQMFLRKPMMQAVTREFHITGGWSDPKVEKVERKLGDPIPEFDAASAPPASKPARPTP